MREERTNRERAAKEKKAKAKKGKRREKQERQSCPCEAITPLDCAEGEGGDGTSQQTGGGSSPAASSPAGVSPAGSHPYPVSMGPKPLRDAAVARRLLIPEPHGLPRYPPVSDQVQRFLEAANMANDDKRAAAALLARRRHAPRNSM